VTAFSPPLFSTFHFIPTILTAEDDGDDEEEGA
jgi:hypothetical protein